MRYLVSTSFLSHPGDIASATRASASSGVARDLSGAGRKRRWGGLQQQGTATSATLASGSGQSSSGQYKSGQSNSGQSNSGQARGTRACYTCNSTSHIARACPKAKKKD